MRIAISPLFAIRSFLMARCGLVAVMLEWLVAQYKASLLGFDD